jgi:2,4-dienoyl-CoA reductase (NADPH2)
VDYQRIDDDGLHFTQQGEQRVIDVDTVVICAGQLPEDRLMHELVDIGKPVHLIGGADEARELDAERAIRQGVELAVTL